MEKVKSNEAFGNGKGKVLFVAYILAIFNGLVSTADEDRIWLIQHSIQLQNVC